MVSVDKLSAYSMFWGSQLLETTKQNQRKINKECLTRLSRFIPQQINFQNIDQIFSSI